MSADKDGIDELCVGLLMNKAKHAKLSKASQAPLFLNAPDREKVLLIDTSSDDVDSDCDIIDVDTTRENQFLRMLEDCKKQIELLKQEIHELKIEVAHLSTKQKKD